MNIFDRNILENRDETNSYRNKNDIMVIITILFITAELGIRTPLCEFEIKYLKKYLSNGDQNW